MTETAPRRWLPHPLVLLSGCVFIAAAATWFLPAGEFDRQLDPDTDRMVAVAGSYHEVEADPVGLFDALIAIPRGIHEAGDVIALVFLIGGALTVVDRTGTLGRAVNELVRSVGGSSLVVIPLVSLAFAAGGVIENMQEEIVALVPVLMILAHRMGYPAIVVPMLSAGPAFIGSSFSFMNPFQVIIAQGVADVEPGSGALFRGVFLVVALALWIGMTLRYAAKHRVEVVDKEFEVDPLTGRDVAILSTVILTFGYLGYGIVVEHWDFNQMSGLFFGMGIVVGAIGGLGMTGTAEAYLKGFRDMAFAALLIGFARSIVLVLQDASVVDTLVLGIFTPLEGLPTTVSAVGMIGAQSLVHIPVPSVSGQAVLTMPIVAPLADLLGMSRQIAVLSYQYGAGLMDLVTPTNGALLAILAAAGLRYEDWFAVAFRMWVLLMGLGAAAVATAVAIGLT